MKNTSLNINRGAYYNFETHRLIKKLISQKLNVLNIPDEIILEIKEILTINKEIKTINIDDYCDDDKIKIIEQIISDCEKTSITNIYTKKRKGEYVLSRHLISALIAILTKLSYYKIAKHIGYKSHCSIVNAKLKVKNYIDTDKTYKQDFINICNLLNIDFDYVYNRL